MDISDQVADSLAALDGHTPGPWEPVRSLTCGHLRAGHNYDSDATVEWTDSDLALIQAAPELLHAIKVIRFRAELATRNDATVHPKEILGILRGLTNALR